MHSPRRASDKVQFSLIGAFQRTEDDALRVPPTASSRTQYPVLIILRIEVPIKHRSRGVFTVAEVLYKLQLPVPNLLAITLLSLINCRITT